MKSQLPFSKAALLIIAIAMVVARLSQPGISSEKGLVITTWDAFGYYLYLPALIIYKDSKKLAWVDGVNQKYSLSGGELYQASRLENGNYVFKYLGGVAILQLPWFLMGHAFANVTDYPADGFSPPYQYAIGFGVIVYLLLALWLLRKILKLYFSDTITAITLLLLCLATNFLQYAAIDNAQSHAWIFPLYTLIIWLSISWHKSPNPASAFAIGMVIGIATICRPTEAVMLFIPLLWNTHTKAAAKEKWAQIRKYKHHFLFSILGGVLGILPQLLYWKLHTGAFIYDVGSKWDFLTPHLQVLFGWEKGWFIYTPVTLFFIAGLFFMKRFPFYKSVLWFTILNLWIVMAWSDWHYGGSYSTRALVQSYPILALPLGALLSRFYVKKNRFFVLPIAALLIGINLFQTWQYNQSIIHFRDNNRKYYSEVFLNPSPSPLQLSLLDTQDWVEKEDDYEKANLFTMKKNGLDLQTTESTNFLLASTDLPLMSDAHSYLKVSANLFAPGQYWGNHLTLVFTDKNNRKETLLRLYRPLVDEQDTNSYSCFFAVPKSSSKSEFTVSIQSPNAFTGHVSSLQIDLLAKKNKN